MTWTKYKTGKSSFTEETLYLICLKYKTDFFDYILGTYEGISDSGKLKFKCKFFFEEKDLEFSQEEDLYKIYYSPVTEPVYFSDADIDSILSMIRIEDL